MTSIQQEAPPIDAAELPSADAPWAEVRDALVAIAVAIAGVASAVAIVIIPQLLPSPAQAPVVCKAARTQQASIRFRDHAAPDRIARSSDEL